MTTNKKAAWENIETLAVNYLNTGDTFTKEEIFGEIFESMQKYVNVCADRAVRSASEFQLQIPKEDFVSEFNLHLWKAIEAFDPTKGKFKSIVAYRFSRIAEPSVWRKYETKDDTEKDGRSYGKARWDSLDKKVGGDGESESTVADMVLGDTPSAESIFVEDNAVTEILKSFSVQNERYANVIFFMYQGYDGDDLAKVLGEGDEYNAKVRKLVQRAKDSFSKFMDASKSHG